MSKSIGISIFADPTHKVLGFPGQAAPTDPGCADGMPQRTLKDYPFDNEELGKPHMDINGAAGELDHPRSGGAGMAYSPDFGHTDGHPGFSPATEILKKASGLIDGERNLQHGDRKECHTLIAKMWSAYKGVEFTPNEVACMMVLLKMARTKSGSYNGDCYVDAAGYAALAGELADTDD